MAKVTSPLLSLGASGTIGDTITFGRWKGLNTARQRVVPANPQSAGQVAQRAIMTAVVAFWRGFLTGTQGKTAWNRDASNSGLPQSGFNAFASAAAKIKAQDDDASMVVGVSDTAYDGLTFTTMNLDDGAEGDEAGNFTLSHGTAIGQMLSTVDIALSGGDIIKDFSGTYVATDVIYCQITKTAGSLTAAKRSGIFQITLTA